MRSAQSAFGIAGGAAAGGMDTTALPPYRPTALPQNQLSNHDWTNNVRSRLIHHVVEVQDRAVGAHGDVVGEGEGGVERRAVPEAARAGAGEDRQCAAQGELILKN